MEFFVFNKLTKLFMVVIVSHNSCVRVDNVHIAYSANPLFLLFTFVPPVDLLK